MDKTIKILIQKPDNFKPGEFKELYRNTIEWPSTVLFDFNNMESSLRILYPGSLITFTILP